MQAIVLRYGLFYGPGTVFAEGGATLEDVEARRFPLVGRGRGQFAFVHVDDAARATVAAMESDARGVFNVAEASAPASVWLPAYAQSLGAPAPRTVPRWLARLVAGPYAVHYLDGMPGVNSDKARHVLGWVPTRLWSAAPTLDARAR